MKQNETGQPKHISHMTFTLRNTTKFDEFGSHSYFTMRSVQCAFKWTCKNFWSDHAQYGI